MSTPPLVPRGTQAIPIPTSPCGFASAPWVFTKGCIQRNIFLVVEHMLGKDNVAVDQESRLMKYHCNRMLNPLIFTQINQLMGPSTYSHSDG